MQMPVLQDKYSIVYGQQLYGALYRTARFHQFQNQEEKNTALRWVLDTLHVN